jgi:undecaprenyl-diphosphatase
MTVLKARVWQARRVELTILLAFLVACLAAVGFLKFASEVAEGDTRQFDRMILLSLRDPLNLSVPLGPTWLKAFMLNITALGSAPVLVTIIVIVIGYLLIRRKTERASATLVAVSVGYALSAVLKTAFSRPRPDVVTHLVDVTSASFPSGHAMNSAVVYLTLAVMLAQAEKDGRARIYVLSCGVLLTLLVGVSRVYLGVHWPTDVIAGWAVGALWALMCSVIGYLLMKRDPDA